MRTFRLRTLMIATIVVNRRWLLHPWQLTTRGYSALVALVAAAVVVSGFPPPMIAFTAAISSAVLVSLRLARFGFSKADIATLLAILFVGTMLLLPEMDRTKYGSAGGRYFPRPIPARFAALIHGEQVREPF
jgi:hypothetical protein